MARELIKLDLIDPNPWQPRTTEDPERTESIGMSIGKDDILQPPAARPHPTKPGRYQLAFGHTRNGSFHWLNKLAPERFAELGLTDRYDGYSSMPLEIHEMNDEAMYRHAVAENMQRKDLNVIEEALAMKRAMDDFHYTSARIGELFGKNEATVRGTIRLLDLPESAQHLLATGQISQNAARRLLTLQKVLPASVEEVAAKMPGVPDPESVIGEALKAAQDKVFQMWQGWRNADVRGGEGLWPLNHTEFEHLPHLKAADAAKALGWEFTAQNRPDLENWIGKLEHRTITQVIDDAEFTRMIKDGDFKLAPKKDIDLVVSKLLAEGAPADAVEVLAHLIEPPSCTACPFMAKSRNDYYCGLKACHNRKRISWLESELEKHSQELGISVYDPGEDGKFTLDLSRWNDEHKELFEKRDPDLRLKASTQTYGHDFISSESVKIVLVGERAKKIKEKERQQQQSRNSSFDHEAWQRRNEMREANRVRIREFVLSQALPHFEHLADAITSPTLLTFIASRLNYGPLKPPGQKAPKTDVQLFYKRVIAYTIIHADMPIGEWLDNEGEQGAIKPVAKYVRKLAKEHGVELPAGWPETNEITAKDETPLPTKLQWPKFSKRRKHERDPFTALVRRRKESVILLEMQPTAFKPD